MTIWLSFLWQYLRASLKIRRDFWFCTLECLYKVTMAISINIKVYKGHFDWWFVFIHVFFCLFLTLNFQFETLKKRIINSPHCLLPIFWLYTFLFVQFFTCNLLKQHPCIWMFPLWHKSLLNVNFSWILFPVFITGQFSPEEYLIQWCDSFDSGFCVCGLSTARQYG